MAENMSTLQDTLGTVPTLLGGLGKRRSPEARGQFAAENYPEVLRGQAEAEFEAATKKGAAKEAGIRGEAEAERGLATTMREQTEELEGGLKPYQEFKAPEYKASDYAADAAKRLVIGLLMGGVSKLSAEGQLRATKAMQDAEDQGLQDQFMQAKLAFDEGEKARQDHNKNLKDRFDRLKDLAVQDRTAAAVEAKLLAAQMENGAIAASLRSGNYLKAIKQFEDAMKLQDQFALERMKGELRTAAKGTGRAGQYALTYASRVYGNIQNAYQDLENIQNLPDIAQSPVLSGLINRDPETAFGSVTALVGRKVTDKEARAFDQVANSLSAALARLESQGLASGGTKANIAAFDAVKPRAGDDAINMALYIARVKQEIQVGINVHEKMPGATEEQKQEAKAILRQLDQIVPFDTQDVMEVLRQRNKPMSEKMNRILDRPSIMEQVKPETIERDGRLFRLNPETGKYREVISGE